MDETEQSAAVAAELPAVLAGLARRFPGTRVTADEVRKAADHLLRAPSDDRPRDRGEVFAWLFAVACRRHVMALVAECQPEIAAQLAARYRRAAVPAEDVVQAAYLKAHRAIEASPDLAGLPLTPAAARAWFARIARNAAIDAFRGAARRPAGPLGDALAATLPAPASDPGPAGRLGPCLSQLPEAERRVAELYLAGRKPAAIAQSLDTPVGRVYERIRSAKDRLRRCLGEYAPEGDV